MFEIEQDQNERLVLTMHAMATAFAGTAKQRQDLANVLTGNDTSTGATVDDMESLMQHLATPVANESTEQQDAREWALSEFDVNDPAFKSKE